MSHALIARGLAHERDYRVDGERSRPDIAFPADKVALYVDGCFWHGCPQHFTVPKVRTQWWVAKVDGNRVRDAAAENRLRLQGWRVIRVWSHDQPVSVADAVGRVLLASAEAHAG